MAAPYEYCKICEKIQSPSETYEGACIRPCHSPRERELIFGMIGESTPKTGRGVFQVKMGDKSYPWKLCCKTRVERLAHSSNCIFNHRHRWKEAARAFGRKQNFTWEEYFTSLCSVESSSHASARTSVREKLDSPHECDVIQRLSENYRNLHGKTN